MKWLDSIKDEFKEDFDPKDIIGIINKLIYILFKKITIYYLKKSQISKDYYTLVRNKKIKYHYKFLKK